MINVIRDDDVVMDIISKFKPEIKQQIYSALDAHKNDVYIPAKTTTGKCTLLIKCAEDENSGLIYIFSDTIEELLYCIEDTDIKEQDKKAIKSYFDMH